MSPGQHATSDPFCHHHHEPLRKLNELADRDREIAEREAIATRNPIRGFIVLLGVVIIVALAPRH
ncbi:MAG: hypothetical protein CFR70_12415 [Rhodocyclaceae bacterium]|nr:MAG: hypothetical protein CFR70_12415 [Rhodocyclaceae bacterium]